MTKFERISVGVSLIALVISLLSPALTYYWFDSAEKEFLHRGLFVTTNNDLDELPQGQHPTVPISITVKNIGLRPADSVQISARYSKKPAPMRPFFIRDPIDFETKEIDGAYFFNLSRSIAPGQSLTLHFDPQVTNAYISNKYGDTLHLIGYGFNGGGSAGD